MAVVAVRRADEIAQVMNAVREADGSTFMWTGTIRHQAGDRLGLSRSERSRRGTLDQRRKWRKRLGKLAARRAERELAWAKGWDVDERQAEDDEITEASIRKKIAKADPEFRTHGAAAVEQADADAAELARLDAKRGVWDAVTEAWHAATSGSTWTKVQKAAGGVLGWVKVTEVTDGGTPAILAGCADAACYSGNGWHVHVHALICMAEDVSEDIVREAVGAPMFAAWRSKLRSMGFDASEEHGWDLRKTYTGDGSNLHDYFMKQAHEVTGSHRKEGKRYGGRTPMQLLITAVETYRVEDVARWWVWESASEGRKQLTWSKGLREFAGLGREQTDEEVTEETLGEVDGVDLEEDTWQWITAHRQESALLDAAEIGGVPGARAWLTRHGLDWLEVDPADLARERERAGPEGRPPEEPTASPVDHDASV